MNLHTLVEELAQELLSIHLKYGDKENALKHSNALSNYQKYYDEFTANLPKSLYEMAVTQHGKDVVDYAEGMYETDFDKVFWDDLDMEERAEYFYRAKGALKRKQK